MFGLLKLIIWIVGFGTIAFFVLDHFGYEINPQFLRESKEACLQQLKECQEEYVKQGTENAQCNFRCTDARKLIRKKDEGNTSSHGEKPSQESP